ncbi:MAG TPA: hypothetical protein VM368_03980, partial [Flavisolibacter sp.]|nr:hypothetical protein [Flavisolibacter sp.]
MPIPIKFFLLAFSCFIAVATTAQDVKMPETTCKVPKSRELWHDYIDREQKNAYKAGGPNTSFSANNEQINYYITNAIGDKIDRLQCKIEKDTTIWDQKKVGYLRGMEKFLKNFIGQYRVRQFNASSFPTAVEAYEAAIELDKKGESIEALIEKQSHEVGKIIVESGAFDRNPGFTGAKHSVLKKYLNLHPERIFLTLKENMDVSFLDSLIIVAGNKYPRQLYDYAAAENRLGYAIRKVQEPFVQVISKMATSSSGSGQLYFPFLDNILKGRQTLKEIDDVKKDPIKYYKLLVKTKMDYVHRQLEGEKILEMQSLNAMLEKKAVETFIKEINELHDKPDVVRFKILQQLNSEELYFVIINGERDLYTSSYVRGVYPLMMQKVNNRGDSLLLNVGFSHFKKFIKLAAGYNTLSNFLNSFPNKDAANTLMTAFVNGLEKSNGLEDGVDVADSYASIVETMRPVADEMLANVKYNYEQNVKRNNKRGIVIYDLLYKLFQSSTDSSINLSKEFNIPPVYSLNYSTLAGDSGKVVMQVFFYGDEDGRYNYSRFVPQFSASTWKRTENKHWIEFESIKGKKVVVYANKPLAEETGEVDKAQEALCKFLEQKEIYPTIVIHRGHSYYAPYTIEQLPSSARLVFLGSCGGYHLIHDVLSHATDAHIIASKQNGRQVINQPFFDLLNEKMLNGSNIEWISFWKEFEKR